MHAVPEPREIVVIAESFGRQNARASDGRSAFPGWLALHPRSSHKVFQSLGRPNLFALAFRTNNMKTAAGRSRKIEELVAMLARGETIVPEPASKRRLPAARRSSRRPEM